MQVYDLFSALIGNYQNKYASIAEMINQRYAGGTNRSTNSELPAIPQAPAAPPPTDSYQPSEQAASQTEQPNSEATYERPTGSTNTTDQPTGTTDQVTDTDTETPAPGGQPTDPQPTEPQPDSTYSYVRKARLDYKLTLKFDMSAMLQTVTKLADGEIESIEQLAAAGFGLTTDFKLKGKQIVRETGGDTSGEALRLKQMDRTKSRNVGKFKVQSRDFNMKAAYKEATDSRSSLDVKAKDNARQAINKISLRYRSDNRFSFAFAERFNRQISEVNKEMPEATGQYADTAGDVALNGSTEMMGTFFDAVDGYLEKAEGKTLESVSKFFAQAAEALGFSGEQVQAAAEHLTGTIESFFDQVGEAVSQMEARFVPSDNGQSEQPDTSDVAVGEPAEYAEPDSGLMDRDGQLAVA